MTSEKNTIRDFKELVAWQKSFDVVKQIYSLSAKLPSSEKFGITSQIQHAAVAIPSNIAEGCNRNHRAEFIQFLGIALGSSAELETQLLLIQEIYKIQDSKILETLGEAQRMLRTLIKKLRSS